MNKKVDIGEHSSLEKDRPIEQTDEHSSYVHLWRDAPADKKQPRHQQITEYCNTSAVRVRVRTPAVLSDATADKKQYNIGKFTKDLIRQLFTPVTSRTSW
jgi:hypothetical protein